VVQAQGERHDRVLFGHLEGARRIPERAEVLAARVGRRPTSDASRPRPLPAVLCRSRAPFPDRPGRRARWPPGWAPRARTGPAIGRFEQRRGRIPQHLLDRHVALGRVQLPVGAFDQRAHRELRAFVVGARRQQLVLGRRQVGARRAAEPFQDRLHEIDAAAGVVLRIEVAKAEFVERRTVPRDAVSSVPVVNFMPTPTEPATSSVSSTSAPANGDAVGKSVLVLLRRRRARDRSCRARAGRRLPQRADRPRPAAPRPSSREPAARHPRARAACLQGPQLDRQRAVEHGHRWHPAAAGRRDILSGGAASAQRQRHDHQRTPESVAGLTRSLAAAQEATSTDSGEDATLLPRAPRARVQRASTCA